MYNTYCFGVLRAREDYAHGLHCTQHPVVAQAPDRTSDAHVLTDGQVGADDRGGCVETQERYAPANLVFIPTFMQTLPGSVATGRAIGRA